MTTEVSATMTTRSFDSLNTTSPKNNVTQLFHLEEMCANASIRGRIAMAGGWKFFSEDDCLDQYYPDTNRTSRMIKFYFLAFIIPIGLLLNLLSGAVFLRSKLRKMATALYFCALACADNTVLFAELLNWLNTKGTRKDTVTGLTFVHDHTSVCKFIQFLRYFGWLLSAWLVVIICIERFIAIAFPLRAISSRTKGNSKFIIPALAVICIGVASPSLVFLGTEQTEANSRCNVQYHHLGRYRAWLIAVRIVGELAIPNVIVTIFTSMIILKLVRANQRRSALTGGQQDIKVGFNATIALVAVAIAFVTLRTPYFLAYTHYLFTQDNSVASLQARDVSYILAVLNYAINFFLYMVTTKTFRVELQDLLCLKSTKRRTDRVRSSKLAKECCKTKKLEPAGQYRDNSCVCNDNCQATALTSGLGAETAV